MRRTKVLVALVILGGVAFWLVKGRSASRSSRGHNHSNEAGEGRRWSDDHRLTDAETWKRLMKNASVPQFKIPDREIPPPTAYSDPSELGETFAREERHPQWAPEMEATVQIRLNSERVKKLRLPGIKVDMECRTSTCRFSLEYPVERMQQRALEAGYAPNASPVVFLINELGPFGSVGFPADNDVLMRNGEQWRREVTILGYDKAAMDPDNHAAWARSQLPQVQESIRSQLAAAAAAAAKK